MAKSPIARTDNARPVADQVDPAVPNMDLTPPANEVSTSSTDAPVHDAEPSRGASTPKTQDGNTLYPDGNTKPDEKAMKAAEDDGTPPSDDPLLARDEDARPLAGATDEVEVKTTGSFVLMDPFTGKHFNSEQTTKTPCTQWVQDQIAAKRLA